MTTALTTALSRAAAATFEELAFLFAAPAAPGDARDGEGVAVRVDFRGPVDGCLELRLAAALLPALAANMLGTEAAPDAALQRDALGEIANVVCGTVLPVLAGTAAVFDLGAPHAIAAPAGVAPVAVAHLVIDGGWAEVRLHVTHVLAAA